mmetsp:Transcript_107529/g.269747  ORF Transcript_107529/g.269747 Transcript_107529/m.269747 type:complete len:233 (+) Transcript_107529:2137-2835(+)
MLFGLRPPSLPIGPTSVAIIKGGCCAWPPWGGAPSPTMLTTPRLLTVRPTSHPSRSSSIAIIWWGCGLTSYTGVSTTPGLFRIRPARFPAGSASLAIIWQGRCVVAPTALVLATPLFLRDGPTGLPPCKARVAIKRTKLRIQFHNRRCSRLQPQSRSCLPGRISSPSTRNCCCGDGGHHESCKERNEEACVALSTCRPGLQALIAIQLTVEQQPCCQRAAKLSTTCIDVLSG